MISVSRGRNLDPKNQAFFDEVSPKNIAELAKYICSQVWSPIVYKCEKRVSSAYHYAEVVALDFDNDGAVKTPLSDMVDWCNTMGVSYIIGTTKSHGIEKITAAGVVKPAVDRYRVIFIGEGKCFEKETYVHCMSVAVDLFNSDRSGKDAARFFYPCKEIVAIGRGSKWQWEPPPIGGLTSEKKLEKTLVNAALDAEQGVMPPWLLAIINGFTKIEPGGRHTTCYKLGYHLSIRGWNLGKIVNQIMTKTSLRDIGAQDVERAVRNGYEKAYADVASYTESRSWAKCNQPV